MSIAPPLIGFAHESNATAAPSLAGRVHPGSSIAVVAQRRRPAVLLVRDDASHESQASPGGTRAWNASQYTLHEDAQNLPLLPNGPGRTRTCVERIMSAGFAGVLALPSGPHVEPGGVIQPSIRRVGNM